MRTALGLARRGLGNVWPNPAVGCVLVKNGRCVGRGWTQPGGRPHAEAVALAQAGPEARGATAYVTLEPCAHHGRTPPCADALAKAGIARAVIALEDPDPQVSGRGFQRLRSAGIETSAGLLAEPAAEVNAGFLSRVTRGRPSVTLKFAQSLDGRIATATGDSRWLTGPRARRKVHALRAAHDAIMIGAGTARADDPSLDVRDLGMADRSPVRVIVDGSLSVDLTSRLARTAGAGHPPLWLCHGPGAEADRARVWRELGAELIEVPAAEQLSLSLPVLMSELAARGITRVFCEGGARLGAALLADGLVDCILTFTAGLAVGGDGLPALSALGIDGLANLPRFRLAASSRLDGDVLCDWRPAAAP